MLFCKYNSVVRRRYYTYSHQNQVQFSSCNEICARTLLSNTFKVKKTVIKRNIFYINTIVYTSEGTFGRILLWRMSSVCPSVRPSVRLSVFMSMFLSVCLALSKYCSLINFELISHRLTFPHR